MTDTYGPRTVALVALASLVVGFLAVFAGGLVMLRPTSRDTSPANEPAAAPPPPRPRADASSAAAPTPEPAAAAGGGASAEPAAASAPAAEPVSAAGVTLSPSSTSRCFDQGNPAALASAACDQLASLDQFLLSKAADLASCARSGAHGRLLMILDFRFSTSFMRGWGAPTSNVPNAGDVAACVRRVITPLPFATMTHRHDRYILSFAIDW